MLLLLPNEQFLYELGCEVWGNATLFRWPFWLKRVQVFFFHAFLLHQWGAGHIPSIAPQLMHQRLQPSLHVRRPCSWNRHWSCLKRCGQKVWSQTWSCTTQPLVLLKRPSSCSRYLSAFRSQMWSHTAQPSVHARRPGSQEIHWSSLRGCDKKA